MCALLGPNNCSIRFVELDIASYTVDQGRTCDVLKNVDIISDVLGI